jgi:dipeptidyl-peptidase-4
MKQLHRLLSALALLCLLFPATAQQSINWNKGGSDYTTLEANQIVRINPITGQKDVVIAKNLLTPKGANDELKVRSYSFSEDNQKVLIYTNTKRVWRYDTKGDYWILDSKPTSFHN